MFGDGGGQKNWVNVDAIYGHSLGANFEIIDKWQSGG